MENLNYFFIVFATLIVSPFTFGSPTSFPPNSARILKVKSVPPVYSNEIKGVTLYEATIPIFFHTKLPKLPDTFPFRPQDENLRRQYKCSETADDEDSDRRYFCALEKQFILASNHIIKDLQEQKSQQVEATNMFHENETEIATGRKKRQVVPILAVGSLVAGFLLRPAISKYTGNLFGTDEEWAKHFNEMRESLMKEHELFLDFEESTHAFTERVSWALSNISETLTEQKRDLIWSLHLLSTKMHSDIVQNSMNSCKTKHLPSNLIPFDFLRKSLEKLEKNLQSKYNYTLAINFRDKDLGKYYKLPLADCLFSAERAHITLNIPLKRNDVKRKLYEIVHTKYAFQRQVCEVYPQEASYLVKEESTLSNRTLLITSHMLKYCSVFEHQLCMVPQFSRDSVQSLKCSSAAAVTSKWMIPFHYDEIIKSCSYRCYTSNELIVTQVEPRKIVVTNAEKISFQCGTSPNTTLKIGRLGAIEINLNCDCTITLNDNERLPQPFPCLPKVPEWGESDAVKLKNLFSFTVPVSWSHNFTELDEEIDSHEGLRNHVNQNWPLLIPVLNFSRESGHERNFTIPEKVVITYGSILTTVEIWLVVLTIALISNFVFTIYCFFKLIMVRYREYELPPPPPRFTKEKKYYEEEMKVMKRENQAKYHLTLIPSVAGDKDKDEDKIFQVDEENVEVVRRERRSGSDDTYESNRNSLVNKLI